MKIASNLFDMLSSKSNIDHPLCEECTDYLLETVDEYLSRTERQTALYEQLLNEEEEESGDMKDLEEELRMVLIYFHLELVYIFFLLFLSIFVGVFLLIFYHEDKFGNQRIF